jgi:3-hydroxyacyl-CoA dehydrogenase
MSGLVSTRRHGDVAIILINNPPVNALSAAVRKGLVEAIEAAENDDAIKAVVIACEGQTFFIGADIKEFGRPPIEPILPIVVDRIEDCTKPVVAAIHGNALGGGLEVALACHYRVATHDAKLGTPEVKLGLIPGSGGTQRLPRVAGVLHALEMCALGNPIAANQAFDCGLIDRIIEGDLLPHAVGFAEEVRDTRPLPKSSERGDKIRDVDHAIFDAFMTANSKRFRGFDAPQAAVEAVRIATQKSYPEGQGQARKLFEKLVEGEQSAAQRYLFFAERQASKIDGLPDDARPRPVDKVGIIGAGTMGGGIAMCFVSAGIPVTLVEAGQEALDRGLGTIRKNYDSSATKGKLSATQVSKAMGILSPTVGFGSLADCDLIIEAVYEDMTVKTAVFEKLDRVAKPGAILATNTSYLDVDAIAAGTSRPGDVLGLHFFSPANVMKLLEVVRGARTAPDILLTAMAVARRIGKIAVVSGVCHGFIGNRILKARQSQALQLLLEGARPEQVDRVHVDFGMPMGPFQMQDLAGVDIGWHRDPNRIETVRDALCAVGRFGQKSGAGFYDYDEKRRATSSPVVEEIVAKFAADQGIERREISGQEIVERTLYPMVNEGAKIIEEGIAQRASDVDVVWVNGYGWPRYRGGPMFWADSIGLSKIVGGLERQKNRLGADFTLSKLLVEKAQLGQRITG